MHVARITIFPIKALDGVEVDRARIGPAGALVHDREYAIIDASGQVVNRKRTARLYELRASYALDDRRVTFTKAGETTTLDLDGVEIHAYLSQFLGLPVTLERHDAGLPDHHLGTPGPTIISTATLREIAGWFALDDDETRRRFRTTLEIDGTHAFGEEQLIGSHVTIGSVEIDAVELCERCVVPARDSLTGAVNSRFQREFIDWRDTYRTAVLTRVPRSEVGKEIRAGDVVEAGAERMERFAFLRRRF